RELGACHQFVAYEQGRLPPLLDLPSFPRVEDPAVPLVTFELLHLQRESYCGCDLRAFRDDAFLLHLAHLECVADLIVARLTAAARGLAPLRSFHSYC
ncbi:MAG: hypothetical protein RIT16_98, partial [Actinomycetota bacterium]